jgi:hypothetical protein
LTAAATAPAGAKPPIVHGRAWRTELIGSLGTSFEGQHYFRHIAYVDEET